MVFNSTLAGIRWLLYLPLQSRKNIKKHPEIIRVQVSSQVGNKSTTSRLNLFLICNNRFKRENRSFCEEILKNWHGASLDIVDQIRKRCQSGTAPEISLFGQNP